MLLKNKRLLKIASLIDNANCIIDVGCDHCLLDIELIRSKKTYFALPIDINYEPLQSGIRNIKKYGLIDRIFPLVNDGLKNLSSTIIFDYLIIAGLGSNKIIDIIKNHHLSIKNYILQSNNNPYLLQEEMEKLGFKKISSHIVYENKIYYFIFHYQKDNRKTDRIIFNRYIDNDLLDNYKDIYIEYLKDRMSFYSTINISKVSSKLKNEYQAIKDFLHKYEN
ncbi:class I SAM-dependent methyltransferase [Ureaplasma canigenitalium]|uniref:class I SAM-dependent methyltransferase n=1 Tax=Ureaplasma canigenitalium TaxID=42092 RepID=UPI0004E1C3AE|nr:class I SAM-dependent methyltransferase [Ureaplasma canigenitalium]